MRTLVPILLAVTLLAGCGRGGGGGGGGRPAPDVSTPEAVLVEAHRALAAGDWASLQPFLTVEGRARAEADLKAWHDVLTDPVTGPRAAGRIPMPADEAGRAVARRAIAEADTAALLWLLVLTDPRPVLPPLAPVPRAPDVARAELSYPVRGGEQRRVVLVRQPDGWRIDRLQL
jgi:hypothetical protein